MAVDPPANEQQCNAGDRFRLPANLFGKPAASKRPPRHRPGEAFLKGPIPFAWMATACRLPGSGLHVATTCRHLCDRFGSANRWGLELIAAEIGVHPATARRGFHAAEAAGLIRADREPGCKLSVSILDTAGGNGAYPRPLYGPIPWDWWRIALRLDGPALPVAVACWMVAGWDRSAEFEFPLGSWGELGLSRFAARRGLDSLERVGLVILTHRPGRSPIVDLLEVPRSPIVLPEHRQGPIVPKT